MAKDKNTFTCCLCGGKFHGYGNNPQGAVSRDANDNIVLHEFKEGDRCCDECDGLYVIPGRMYRLALARQKQKEEEAKAASEKK
jgi:hypothetical protein